MTLPETVLQSGLLPHEGILTAAFSGGADSTALLLCLAALQADCGYTLRAVHVHHGIRGAEADRDAAFCEALCAERGIPFRCVQVDAPAYAAAHRLSLETAARRLRYEALETAAPEGLIATAHHAADNAETMLFHLIRGSGMRGLCGIPPRNGRIIRPMLAAEKQEILQYLSECGQGYVEDSSNFSQESTRSRIRQTLLPLLKQENPAYLRHFFRTAAVLSEDDAFLRAEAQKLLDANTAAQGCGFSVPAQTPKPLRMRMYLLRLAALGIDPSYDMLQSIDGLLAAGSGKQNLCGDVYAQVTRGMLYLCRQPAPLTAPVPLQAGENRVFAGKCCTAVICDTEASQDYHRSDIQYTLDFDKIKGTPFFRRRQGSDRMQPAGRAHSSALKTLVQAAVPEPERSALHILYDAQGCILCERVGAAQRVMPDAQTRRLLMLCIRPDGAPAEYHPVPGSAGTTKEKE